MAVEQAQHLIAMSLGKMAASRNQRGGANLHRSLLVSTVLHKARTTIMMENFQAMMQQRRAQMEAQQREQEQQQCQQQQEQVVPEVEAAPAAALQERVAAPASAPVGKENQPPAVTSPQQQHQQPLALRQDSNNNTSCVLSTSTSHNINTTTTTQKLGGEKEQESSSENSKPNCARCLKRRVTELGPADAMESLQSAKRIKYESDSELSLDGDENTRPADQCGAFSSPDSSSDEEEEDDQDVHNTQTIHEPMQTDQLSSLVHRFNSGLSGLLTMQAEQQQQNSEQQQQFTSCCTQVKDSGIESLSRPCIALTV